MTSTAWLLSSRTGRQARPGTLWSSAVLETSSMRTESSARFLFLLFVLLWWLLSQFDFCFTRISLSHLSWNCTSPSLLERKTNRWILETPTILVVLLRQLTLPEAVLCEICVKLEVISQCHNKWPFVHVKSFPFILPLRFSELWSLGINPLTMEDMVGKWKLEKRDPNFEEFLICRQVNGTLRDHLTLDS